MIIICYWLKCVTFHLDLEPFLPKITENKGNKTNIVRLVLIPNECSKIPLANNEDSCHSIYHNQK